MHWLSALIAFAATAVLGVLLIPVLRRLKFGQSILEIGPKWHKGKSGTPTMGGIMFAAGISVAALTINFSPKTCVLVIFSLLFGIIGFVDDYISVVKKRNMGLTSAQKFGAQAATAIALVLLLRYMGVINTEIRIPFTDKLVDMGLWFIPFVIFVIVGTVNSVNLTDGLDGLAATITAVAAIFFTIAALALKSDVAVFTAAIVGGCLGFLIFNAYPARVFMGDTGSLFLGGAICVTAIMLRLEIFLIIVGGVYLLEALSVIIQVVCFKITGKRVFKMSPIHHHFEMCGWKETKIVAVFSLITAALCVIGYIGLK